MAPTVASARKSVKERERALRARPRLALLSLLALAMRIDAASLVYDVTPAPGGGVRVSERATAAERAAMSAALPALDDAPSSLLRWVETSARAVAGYYGRLPVPRATLELHATGRGGVGYGHTQGEDGGARIDVNLGSATTRASLDEDWVLVHELVHTALPRVPRYATWLDEGLATYVEPIARARLGARAADLVWADLAWGLPKGLPQDGDEGLDKTHTWGRTYWGGALFAFLLDLDIRERTHERKSLREALVGVLEAGGNVTKRWSLEEVLAAMDRATGTRAATELHERMGTRPLDPKLAEVFARLGVSVSDGKVTVREAPREESRRLLPTGATRPAGPADPSFGP